MFSIGEPVEAFKRQINMDRDENAATIDKISVHDRLVDCDRLFSNLSCMLF
jgi:hypothetical protein